MDVSPATYRVNELTPDPGVAFDPKVVKDYVTYAHRIANSGLVNSSVGGMVIRVAHPSHPEHGVCYAKPQGLSLEEVEEGGRPRVLEVPAVDEVAAGGVSSRDAAARAHVGEARGEMGGGAEREVGGEEIAGVVHVADLVRQVEIGDGPALAGLHAG